MKRDFIIVAAAAFVVLGAQASFAASHSHKADPGCSTPLTAQVNETYVVSAWGIPTDTAVNLWVTAPDGTTTGSPLGGTPDGTFNLDESSGWGGKWTYTFSGPTKPHTEIFATCSLIVG